MSALYTGRFKTFGTQEHGYTQNRHAQEVARTAGLAETRKIVF